jgi:hypothetical protein
VKKDEIMQTIKSTLTSKQVAEKVVSFIKMFYTSYQMDIHIGLTENGEVDYHHNVHASSSDIIITLYDTSSGWKLGDWDGDYGDENTWTKENEAWLCEALENWNSEALMHNEEYNIELAD